MVVVVVVGVEGFVMINVVVEIAVKVVMVVGEGGSCRHFSCATRLCNLGPEPLCCTMDRCSAVRVWFVIKVWDPGCRASELHWGFRNQDLIP